MFWREELSANQGTSHQMQSHPGPCLLAGAEYCMLALEPSHQLEYGGGDLLIVLVRQAWCAGVLVLVLVQYYCNITALQQPVAVAKH